MRNADVLLRRFAKFPRPFAAKQVPTSQLLLLLQANVTDDGERHTTFLGTTPGKLGSESTASKNRRRSNESLRVHSSCGKQERFIYSKPPPNKHRVMNSGQPRFVTLSSYPSHHPPLSSSLASVDYPSPEMEMCVRVRTFQDSSNFPIPRPPSISHPGSVFFPNFPANEKGASSTLAPISARHCCCSLHSSAYSDSDSCVTR